MIQIVPAYTGEPLDHVITLSQEYVTWMIAEIEQHFPDLDIPQMKSGHDYDDVRKKFPGEHIPPYGCLLVALNDDQVSGCIALGKLTDDIGEVRTLFVRPEARGTGVGKRLVEAVLDEARKAGYRRVRLDTLKFMDNAQRLYRSFGFYDIEPYRDFPESLSRYICFFELDLSDEVPSS